MPSGYELIASATVGASPVTTIDFTSIPSTYTDLCLKMSLRTNRGGTFDYATINFNNSAADYTLRVLEGNGSSTFSYTRSTFAVNLIGRADGADATSNTFASIELYLPNYTSSTNKPMSIDSVQENNDSTAYQDLFGGLWSQTAAINRLTITNGTDNAYVQYSTAYLYGIKNS